MIDRFFAALLAAIVAMGAWHTITSYCRRERREAALAKKPYSDSSLVNRTRRTEPKTVVAICVVPYSPGAGAS